MSGLFGGLLSMFEILGGCFFWLLIGKRAWKKSDLGELIRCLLGSTLFGLGVGLVVFFLNPEIHYFGDEPFWLTTFLGIPAGTLSFGGGLLSLKDMLK